jgi:transcriptional regulator with XRE-family HTH domain
MAMLSESRETRHLLHAWAAFLKGEREQQYPSQKALAEKLGCAPSTLRSWEAGWSVPTYTNMMAWAQSLGYDLELVKR